MGWLRWITVIAVFAAASGLALTGDGYSLLQKAGLVARPVSYTALSFENPEALPTQLPSAHTTVKTAFMIHNVSGAPRTYHWFVDITRNDRSMRIRTGTLKLLAESQRVISEILALSCPSGRLKVTISLANPAESIDYWANCLLIKEGGRYEFRRSGYGLGKRADLVVPLPAP